MSMCTLCSQFGIDIKAEEYCVGCKFHLCRQCLEYHNKFPAHAKPGRLDQADHGSAEGRTNAGITCQVHRGKAIDRFCPSHDEVCCEVCVAMKHRSCERTVPIREVAEGVRESEEWKQVKLSFERVMKHIAKENDKRNENIKTLNSQKNKILAEINKQEDDLTARVRELGDISRQEVSKKHEDCIKAVQSDVKALETVMSLSPEYSQKLNDTESGDMETFINIKNCKQIVKDAEEVVAVLSEKWLQAELEFSFDNALLVAATDLKSLGDVVEKTKLNTTYTATHCKKINVKLEVDKKSCEIMGICRQENGDLVISDYENGRLKRFDADLKIKDYIDLPGNPVSMCITGKQEVALALREQKKIQFVSCGEQLSLGSLIDTPQMCSGLCYNSMKEELFVCCLPDDNQRGAVHVLEKSGKVLRSIITMESAKLYLPCQIICLPDESSIVLADTFLGVKKMDTNGSEMWTYSEGSLCRPWGVCRLPYQQYLVSDVISSNVLQLNKDGEKVVELLGEKEKLNVPSVLTFEEDSYNLMVGGIMDCVLVVKLART